MVQISSLFQRHAGAQNITPNQLLLQQASDLKVEGSSGECGLKVGARVFLFKGNEVHRYISERLAAAEEGTLSTESFAFEATALCSLALGLPAQTDRRQLNASRALEQLRDVIRNETRSEVPIPVELVAILSRQYRLFNSTLGERSGSPFTNWQSSWDG
jgi:hypothetical protein